jgi:hypothetical protein
MFGVPIDQVRRTPAGVPVIVEDTIAFLENHPYAVREEGILRLAGNSQEIKQLREAYERGMMVVARHVITWHAQMYT